MCGIIAALTIIIVQFVDGNIINPIVIGKATDIHPITIVIGLLVFQHYFGILGMIIATPVIGAIKILFNFFNEKYHFIEMIKPVNKEPKKKENQDAEEDDIEEKEETPLIVGRSANIKEQIVKIKDLTPDYGKVALQGKVIRTDSRELKNGKTLVMFDVYDGTSTITCKSFVEPEKFKK